MLLSACSERSPPLFTARLRDVGKEHRYLKQQEYLAAHDSLTGLLNRNAFQIGVQSRIDAAGEAPFGVVLMDLNRLKEINDTLGHQAGDAVLVELGQRLRSLFGRGRGLVARLGGDEIAVCAPLAGFRFVGGKRRAGGGKRVFKSRGISPAIRPDQLGVGFG
jgi:GGDEF domain-containing protein